MRKLIRVFLFILTTSLVHTAHASQTGWKLAYTGYASQTQWQTAKTATQEKVNELSDREGKFDEDNIISIFGTSHYTYCTDCMDNPVKSWRQKYLLGEFPRVKARFVNYADLKIVAQLEKLGHAELELNIFDQTKYNALQTRLDTQKSFK